MVNTPVLFITFARPEYASQSFAAIKKAQPRKLYFYSNKARKEKPDEVKRNEEVRSYIKQIDWDCEVVTWFRDEYVDVFTSLWGAIDWVFDNEDEAIVLEEDCVASLAFFDFCEKLLPKYKDEPRVRLISGDNFTPEYNPTGYDYFFTRLPDIYGWASWRKKWQNLDREMNDWPSIRKRMKRFFPHFLERLYHRIIMDKILSDKYPSKPWDFTTCYNMLKNDEVSITPMYNLVEDIGVSGANHAVNIKKMGGLPKYEGNVYPTERCPEITEAFDSYDYPHFKKYIFWRFVFYELKKYRKKLLKF